MAYIKDYYMIGNKQNDEYLNIEDLLYSDFEQGTSQLNFKVCDESYHRKYFSQKMADPRDYFDDGEFAKNYETLTSVFIQANQGPIVIRNNRFEENIGTFGGAISIISPNFSATNTASED